MPRTATRKPAMSEYQLKALVACEWDFVNLDSDAGSLMIRLTALNLPEGMRAAADLGRIRSSIRRALDRLDEPLTEAVQASESLVPAPF